MKKFGKLTAHLIIRFAQRGSLLAVLLAGLAWMPGVAGGFYNYGMVLGVPSFIEDVETLSRDAKELFRDGLIDSVALSCPIVPRGDPPINKADAFAEMFRALRKRLAGSGIPTGILLYATMGHGGSSTMPSPFQKIILGRNRGEPI